MNRLLSLAKRTASRLGLPKPDQPTRIRTSGYRPLPQIWFKQPRDLPPFTHDTVRLMLLDPGIRLNLAMRAAPFYGVEFAYHEGLDGAGQPVWKPGVKAKNPAVAAWVYRQLQTIWQNYLPGLLKAQQFGWCGGEVTLRLSEYRLIEIDKLIPRQPGDLRLLKWHGDCYGVRVSRINNHGELDLPFPYCYFHSFRPDDGEDYGNSILLGAYSPWADKWLNGGALDTRRLFMHKDAYGGMRVAYPEEDLYVEGFDHPISARDIAAQIAEQRQAGGVVTYPSTLDGNGNAKWRIDEATVASNPQHILQYPKDLDDEIRVGMEIPDDVISSDSTGAWAGKRIPLAAFYASLDVIVVQMLADLRQTLEPLVLLNWGRAEDFEITHKPLARQAMEQQGDAAGQPEAAGGQNGLSQPPTSMLDRLRGGGGGGAAPPVQPMATDPLAAIGQGVLDASAVVQAAKQVLRLATQPEQPSDPQEQAELIAQILTNLFGDDAERIFDEQFGDAVQRMATWNPIDHPRGPDGRFIARNSPEAVFAARQQISDALAGERTPESLRRVTENLSILTSAQLRELQREHGIKAGGAKPSLVQKIAARLHGTAVESRFRDDRTPKAPSREDVYTVPVGSLDVDPKRFQYKVKGVGQDGVTDELKGVRTWNPELAGTLLVWRDPEDGRDYVVNGHHRHELASRLGADKINVRYIEARSATEARAKGALANIAEGRGTAIDAAKYLRDSRQDVEHLRDAGISLSGRVAADAAILKDLADKPFQRVTQGTLDEAQAVAVARWLKDHDRQNDLFRLLERREEDGKEWSTREIEAAAKKMANAGSVTRTGSDLFGDFEEEQSTWEQEVELEAHVGRMLAQEANDFRAVASRRRADRVSDAGNVLATEENSRRAARVDEAVFDFDRQLHAKGSPISEAVQFYAADLATATKKKDREAIREQTLGSIRAALGIPHDGDRDLRTGRVYRGGEFRRDEQTTRVIEAATLRTAKQRRAQFSQSYRQKYGRFDASGRLAGITLNTDDWRDQFPQYQGTNAHEVHEASAFLNNEEYKEALKSLRGKGNGRMLILAGGGGSGKGTASKEHLDMRDYPLVLDQASQNYPKLEKKLDEAIAAGFQPVHVFVDRGVESAVGGVVGRAMSAHRRGEMPRTVPLDVAMQANVDARKATLELLRNRVDIPVQVIDNNSSGKGQSRRIDDREEAIAYLADRVAAEESQIASVRENVRKAIADQLLSGQMPDDIAIGLMGEEFVQHTRSTTKEQNRGE